jgi:hypothetical protein
MKNLSILIVLVIIFLNLTIAFAQTSTNKQLDPALRKFVQSEIMIKFKDLKREAENSVSSFKSEMNNYKPDQIQKVKTGYDKTADRFNQELENMKMDFLNKKKLKYIIEFPKDYARSLELNFRELAQYYAENFQQPLQDVRQSKEDGGIVIAIFMELFKLVPEVINHFNEMKEMATRYDDAYLDKWLVTPFKFLTWTEIQAEAGYINMNNTNNLYNNSLNTNPNPYPVSPDPNTAYPPATNQPANAGMDTTKTNTQNWWETNTTLPLPTNIDGSAPAKNTNVKSTPIKTKAPDPFAPIPVQKDTSKIKSSSVKVN